MKDVKIDKDCFFRLLGCSIRGDEYTLGFEKQEEFEKALKHLNEGSTVHLTDSDGRTIAYASNHPIDGYRVIPSRS